MQSQSTASSTVSHLLELPPLASFGSINSSTPPTHAFLAYVQRETGAPSMSFADIQVSVATHAGLRQATREWLRSRRQLALLDEMSEQGVATPIVSPRAPAGHALVAVRSA